MDLSRICASIKNYFVDAKRDIHSGTHTVSDHTIIPSDYLLVGQYFRIKGSVLNDGVYKYTGEAIENLRDETFDGEIWAMRVPKSFIDLVNDFDRFNAKIEELALVDKGFASESFDGYSYTLYTGAPTELLEWKNKLDAELTRYRRLIE